MSSYNFQEFLSFLDKNQITAIIIGYIISIRIYDIINIFFDEIINPIIYIDFNTKNPNTDNSHVRKLEKYEFGFLNVKMKIGKIIVSILKFIFVTYVLFLIIGVLSKILKKNKEKMNMNDAKK